jgi:hypothetical protein
MVPWAEFRLSDEQDAGLVGVRVTLRRVSQPHGRVHEQFISFTDDAGIARFSESNIWELSFPLVPHGVNFYDFLWCAETQVYSCSCGPLPRDGLVVLNLKLGDAGCLPWASH